MCVCVIIIIFFITIIDKPQQSTYTMQLKEPAPARRPSHSET